MSSGRLIFFSIKPLNYIKLKIMIIVTTFTFHLQMFRIKYSICSYFMCIFMEWSYSVLSNNCLKIPKYINHKIFSLIIIMGSQVKSLNNYLTMQIKWNRICIKSIRNSLHFQAKLTVKNLRRLQLSSKGKSSFLTPFSFLKHQLNHVLCNQQQGENFLLGYCCCCDYFFKIYVCQKV